MATAALTMCNRLLIAGHLGRSTVYAERPTSGVSNKPMVPTAPKSPAHYSPGSLRRHIGQPFER